MGTMTKEIGIIALVTGPLCVLFYILHDVIGALNYPGYDPMRQAVSDLTATDAPSFTAAIGYSNVYGILCCVCCIMLCLLVRNVENKFLRRGIYAFTVMNIISAIGYSLFPLSSAGYDGSFQSFVHVYIITILVVILSIASMVSIAVGCFKTGRRTLAIIAIMALLCMFVGAAGSQMVPQDMFGLVERFSTYSAVVFTGILGVYGYMDLSKTENDMSGPARI